MQNIFGFTSVLPTCGAWSHICWSTCSAGTQSDDQSIFVFILLNVIKASTLYTLCYLRGLGINVGFAHTISNSSVNRFVAKCPSLSSPRYRGDVDVDVEVQVDRGQICPKVCQFWGGVDVDVDFDQVCPTLSQDMEVRKDGPSQIPDLPIWTLHPHHQASTLCTVLTMRAEMMMRIMTR